MRSSSLDTVTRLIAENRPADIPWTVDELRAIASSCNLDVLTFGDNEVADLLSESMIAIVPHSAPRDWDHMLILSSDHLGLIWGLDIEGNKASYWPSLVTVKVTNEGEDSVWATDIARSLMRASGVEAVEFELPEDVVNMPSTPWGQDFWTDEGRHMFTPSVFPITDARKYAANYIRQLAETVGLDVTLTAKS